MRSASDTALTTSLYHELRRRNIANVNTASALFMSATTSRNILLEVLRAKKSVHLCLFSHSNFKYPR